MADPVSGADLAAARATVARRLRTALELEDLLLGGLSGADASRIAADPGAALREFAGAGRLRGGAAHVDRAAREIDDGIVGLALARAGLRRRWSGARPGSPAGSGRPFTALVAACRDRCAPGDDGPGARPRAVPAHPGSGRAGAPRR